MTHRPAIDMAEATRLTREGRLDEAMAVLRGQAPAGPAPREAPAIIDLVAPGPGSAGAWTAPPLPGRAGGAPPGGLSDLLSGLGGGLGRGPGTGARTSFGGGMAPAAAPGAALPPGARWEARTHVGAAGRRDWRLYVPSGRPGDHRGEALPLLVMLHGCTQDAEDFSRGTRMNEVAEERGVIVAYPEQTRSANPSGCWNWFAPADQSRGAGEPALVAGIVRDAMAELPVDPGRVWVAGLSAGAAAAAVLGAEYPDLFAAVGVHSGLAFGAAADMGSAFAAMRQGAPGRALAQGVPTIVVHGDRDATVSPLNGDAVIAQGGAGRRLSRTESRGTAPGGRAWTRVVQADAGGRPWLEQWTVHGGGHAWSGGSAAGTYTDPQGPDASRAMLDFFALQPPRPGA